MERGIAVVTGASSGIGAATAKLLADEGYDVVLGARRHEELEAVASSIGGRAIPLDVTDRASVEAFCEQVESCSLLVNNAGGALGLDPIENASDDRWLTMYETNVMGTLRMTRSLLPKLRQSGDAHVVMIGSIAAIQTYDGGAGYTAAKHAVRAFTQTLRLELLGEPIRVTEIDPGMVETEFSVVRFDGDTERAGKVYEGMQPLSAHDIAECVRWVVTLPSHVNIDQMLVMPRDQAAAQRVHRRTDG
jgi:NADP-dependent 3-hydroxy acid dehydrogenase YdfG